MFGLGGDGGSRGVVWGGEQQDVSRSSAAGAGGRYDDNLMVVTEINTAIIEKRLKISQQLL